MDFYDVITKRRSIRKYDVNKKISDETLKRVLNAARIAPSACNFQPWHFIVIKEAKTKEKMKEAYHLEWFLTAPVIIIGCVDTSVAWIRKDGVNYADVDLTIAFDHLILSASNEGLGTCWIGAFNNTKAREVLGVPENIKIVAMTPLGYPAVVPQVRPIKNMDEIIHKEKW